MTIENVISMEPVKKKLENFIVFPSAGEEVYLFGLYLRDRLNEELCPEGFVNAAIFALNEAYDEYCDYKAGKIKVIDEHNPLLCMHESKYLFLETKIPTIARAVCPKDFAAEVKIVYDEICKMRKQDLGGK